MGCLNSTLTLELQLRLCKVQYRYHECQKNILGIEDEDVYGYFHCWGQWKDEHGHISMFGIVELETGKTVTVKPEQIQFIDDVHNVLVNDVKAYRKFFEKKEEGEEK